ncbi:SARP family transcriptional regulator [Nocardiopsis kunsanensis]|uniref:SARP family transcriptional regulator n=1 Tax=Nocardiopsis kunsanensis TaxID=141693 RepID=A0A918XHT4_9ACTN|nr:SARP family transcriptional regulator [Nocardiopsis kunsanensis]
MEFSVLGPITVWNEGRPVTVGGPRQRCVLGALLVHLGREVTFDQLIGYLWSDDPPRTARSVIQVQISHLRRLLPDTIATTAGGYVLDFDPESVDLHRFRRLRERAADAPAHEAAGLLEQSLRCWRGAPFSGVGSEHLAYSVVTPLLEEYWSAVTAWAEHALELGRAGDVVARLTPLTRGEPFRERLHHLLITALWHDNDRAKALTAYEEFRSGLAEELGVDPGAEVMDLHARILREEVPSVRRAVPDEPATASDTYVVRNDLPRDLPDFTGREQPLARMRDLVDGGGDRAQVCVITGSGGEGKTTTAVHFGHGAAEHYPDGQLFIDLYGYNTDRGPLSASSALGALLRAVGVAPEAVPESLDERSALWRATMADRRVLLILDNAFNVTQASPLVLPSPGSLTVITARKDVSGINGARFVSLGMFDEASSLDLLSKVLGESRVEDEPDSARAIARLCGGLPLALRVVAGRILSRPRWSLAHVASRLGERDRRLRELQVEGQSVESAIDLSYQSLNSEQRHAFLLLGMMIGDTVDLTGAAALLGTSVEEADDMLQELVGMYLLSEPQGDVYRLHDLITDFCRSRAEPVLGEETVEKARLSLAHYYLDTARRGTDLLGPRAEEGYEGSTHRPYRSDLSTREDAERWFSLHHENLAETIEFFASGDFGDQAWRMADLVWRFYALRGHMALLVSSHQRALQVSEQQGSGRGRAVTFIGLGIAHYITGRFAEALDLLSQAHEILVGLDDSMGILRVNANLGMVYERVGRFTESAGAIEEALEHAVAVGNTDIESLQWGNLAVLRQSLGQYEEAIHCAGKAMERASGTDLEETAAHTRRVMGEARAALGDIEGAFADLGEALELSTKLSLAGNRIYVYNSLGKAHRLSGNWERAVEEHAAALELADTLGDHSGDAEILADLGVTYGAAGRPDEAARALNKALAMADERDEQYISAKAALALGGLPASVVDDERACELLTSAVRTLTELDLDDAEFARKELARRSSGAGDPSRVE